MYLFITKTIGNENKLNVFWNFMQFPLQLIIILVLLDTVLFGFIYSQQRVIEII